MGGGPMMADGPLDSSRFQWGKNNDRDNSDATVVFTSPFLLIFCYRLQMNKLNTGPGFLAGNYSVGEGNKFI